MTDYSRWLVSELCTAIRGLESDALDCWSNTRMARLRSERAALVAELASRGLGVSS